MLVRTLAAVGLIVLVAGCMGGGSVSGKYAYINWGNSQKQCNNDVCTYGQNAETFEAPIRCNEKTTLSWDLTNWIHGSMTVTVFDPTNEQKDRRILTSNGNGNVSLSGQAGIWTLKGLTDDA